MYSISSFSGEMLSGTDQRTFRVVCHTGRGSEVASDGIVLRRNGDDGGRVVPADKEAEGTLCHDDRLCAFRKATSFCGRWSMVHPEVEPPSDMHGEGSLRPVYPLTEKLRNQG